MANPRNEEHKALGWHTLEDFARWADVKIGDMVRLDVGVANGFPIGYIHAIKPDSITLARYHPNSKPWNEEDSPIEYKASEMTVFLGIDKLKTTIGR